MLSLFPQVLFLAPVGTMLLRVTVGLVYLYWAHLYWIDNERLSRERFPIVGSAPRWLIILGAFLAAVVGVLLLVGLYTQLVAVFAALGGMKSFVWSKRYPATFPLVRQSSIFIIVISVSLVVSGAGAFALDLPL